jgi:type III pantothenate kinase
MLLVIDAGNSSMSWMLLGPDNDCDDPVSSGIFYHEDADDDETMFNEAWAGVSPPDGVLVSNVAGSEFAAALSEWVQQNWQTSTEFVVPSSHAYGVSNAYSHPESLGTDRWVTLIAARNMYELPVCVVDCGTAITLDAIDVDGEHLGGLIVPGISMMQDALIQGTEIEIQDEDIQQSASLLARDTGEGMQAGSVYAAIAFIDRVTTDLEQELQQSMQCIITGGDASRLLPLLSKEYILIPDLVLRGLYYIAMNREAD